MSAAQNKSATVIMDARKFVRHINNGASAKLKFFEEAVQRMGTQVGKNLRLTSLDTSTLIFEDVDKNAFFIADIKKANKNKVDLDNVKQIQVVEEEKSNQFHKNCQSLVEHICEDNLKAADRDFNKIESQRYQSKVIPESGWITLKDGVARRVPVSNRIVTEDHVSNIVKLFSEAVQDNVVLDKGRIVKGSLADDTQKFTIPINEYTRRRLVAHKMRSIAEQAYRSPSFQNLVMEVASLVSEGDIRKACQVAAKFLREEQEFCLLTQKQFRTLTENALAVRGEFNNFIARDTSQVLNQTNLKINREQIIESWTKTAKKAENASLLKNVNILAESQDFAKDHDQFLNLVFNEEMDIQQARAKAYRTTLKVISGVLPELEEDDEVSTSVEELEELIERLSGVEPDTDAVLQAEELLASISDSLIDNIQSLEGFDQEPGEEEEEEEEEEGELVPLPEVGEEEGEGEELEEPGEEMPEMGMEPGEGEGEGEEGLPLAAHAEHPGASRKISKLDANGLLEHAEDWQLNGESYLNEHGYDKCATSLNKYIQRCMDVGPRANPIRESFEKMRDTLLESGGNTLLEDVDLHEDPYADSLAVALNGPTKVLHSSNDKDPDRDPDFVGRSVANESRINRDYVHTFSEEDGKPYASARVPSGLGAPSDELSMDEFQGDAISDKTPKNSDGRGSGGEAAGYDQEQKGTGVTGKGVTPVDGRSGHKSASGAPGGSTRMDDKQGSGGVNSKGLKSSDGRSGSVGQAATPSESTVPAKGGNPSTDLSMGSDFQGKSGKGGVVKKQLQSGDVASGAGAKGSGNYTASGGPSAVGLEMDDLQGGEGVEDDGLESNHPGDTKDVGTMAGMKSASGGGDMSKGQGKGITKHNPQGMSESQFTPEYIASLISEMEDDTCPMECGCKGDPSKCKCPESCPCRKAMSESKDTANGKLDLDGDGKADDWEPKADSKNEDDEDPHAAALARKNDEDEDSHTALGRKNDETMSDDEDSLVEMDDGSDVELNGDDDEVVVVAGKPGAVMDALEDVLADFGSEDEDEEVDIAGDELPDLEGPEAEVEPEASPDFGEEEDEDEEEEISSALMNDEEDEVQSEG